MVLPRCGYPDPAAKVPRVLNDHDEMSSRPSGRIVTGWYPIAMKITVAGQQIDVGETLRDHVQDRLINGVGKYFDHAIDGHVAFSRYLATGIDIARRTVAKYREMLRIPSSLDRRRQKKRRK